MISKYVTKNIVLIFYYLIWCFTIINFLVGILVDQKIQIEHAFTLGLIAFSSGIIFIAFIHLCYFPKDN